MSGKPKSNKTYQSVFRDTVEIFSSDLAIVISICLHVSSITDLDFCFSPSSSFLYHFFPPPRIRLVCMEICQVEPIRVFAFGFICRYVCCSCYLHTFLATSTLDDSLWKAAPKEHWQNRHIHPTFACRSDMIMALKINLTAIKISDFFRRKSLLLIEFRQNYYKDVLKYY